MDLLVVLLVTSIIAALAYLITTKLPMEPWLRSALQILAAVLIVLYVLRALGLELPNVLP